MDCPTKLGQVSTATAVQRLAVDGEIEYVAYAKDDGEGHDERQDGRNDAGNKLPDNKDADDSGNDEEDGLYGSRHFVQNSWQRFVTFSSVWVANAITR